MSVIILKELVHWRSKLLAARALRARHIVFPFFPPELAYMNTRSSIKRSPRIESENGWAITPEVIRGLATNPKQIGVIARPSWRNAKREAFVTVLTLF